MRAFIRTIYIKIILFSKRYSLKALPGVRLSKNTVIDFFTSLEPYVSIGSHCNITSSSIGYGTYITEYSSLRHTKIGRFCCIADNVRTGNGSHPTKTFVSSHPAFFSTIKQSGFTFVDKPLFNEMPFIEGSNYVVEIGNDVWIGSGVRILDGITIGDGAIIGAGSIVTKNIEPYAIYAGIPSKKIRYRFSPERIEFLLTFRWWDKEHTWLAKNAEFFLDEDIFYETFNNQIN
ncbi:CatB-related O-acetyltransferase [Methylobacter psychrophilus]|uniref:CatB-related O-acetyltransferase n=1 Tax=Methylobacter psychrophilus TaxID=96941 RepID=UPI00374E09EC